MSDTLKYSVKTYGHDVLKKKALPVESITDEVKQLADAMIAEMNRFNGIGLAAPQIGVSQRVVVLGIPDDPDCCAGSPGEALLLPRMPLAIINPEIIAYSSDSVPYDEGCLSVPDIYGRVYRPSTVILRAAMLDGSTIECECGGLLGRCLQHEIDHLDGYLFVDRMNEDDFRNVNFKLFRLEKYGKKHNFERSCKK